MDERLDGIQKTALLALAMRADEMQRLRRGENGAGALTGRLP